MLETLRTIVKDNWDWKSQIGRLALFELKKQSRGAVLGWVWFFVKPAIYLFCFWFALRIGLRVGSTDPNSPPFMLWLAAGIIPWFFMSDMINTGVNVLKRYPYLVNKIKFPLSAISGIYICATMILHLMLLVVLFAIYFFCGMKVDVYLLQVPVLLILMLVFWDMFSILFSQLSAISKDVANLMKALSTPLFWLSGILFSVDDIKIPLVQRVLDFNPVTFFVRGYRMAFYDKAWIWNDCNACIGFLVAFVIVFVLMLVIYRLFNEEVADVF